MGATQMSKYAIYIRTKEGYIERMRNVISNRPDGALAPYVHEESLAGFPEPTVFWVTHVGPSIGIAPLDSRSDI